MANHSLPRRSSAVANALVTLDGANGKLSLARWRTIIGWKGSRTAFDQNVVDRLYRAGLVRVDGDLVEMTAAGLKFVGLRGTEVAEEPQQLAGPRFIAPARPLDNSRRGPPRPVRAGAMDYLNFPSRMGCESVPYKGATSFADA